MPDNQSRRNSMFLIKFCLNKIAYEFDRFYFAFKRTDNATLQHHFHFLQRKYSFEIASKLHRIGKFHPEYLEFFLNAYLKQLNCHWLSNLKGKILKHLPNLTKISFTHYCYDKHIKIIANHCPQLLILNVKSSYVTDKGIRYLCRSLQLETLFVKFSKVTEEGVNYVIQNMPSLQNIDYNIGIPHYLYLSHKFDDLTKTHKYNLTSLNFETVNLSPNFTNILEICLAVCPKLKSLEYCLISNQQQLDLFKNLQLKNLDIKMTNANLHTTSFFKNNGFHLSYLNIENCTISMSDLILSCPKLYSLYINNVIFIGNSSQLTFKCLEMCNMFNYKSNSASTKTIDLILLCSPQLQFISFTCCTFLPETNTNILQYCENHSLKKIFFNYCNINICFIKFLQNVSFPPVIYLNSNSFKTIPDCLIHHEVYTNTYPVEFFLKEKRFLLE